LTFPIDFIDRPVEAKPPLRDLEAEVTSLKNCRGLRAE